MAGHRPAGPRVAVYDCEGYYVAAGIAELLATQGYEVHLVTTHPVVSPLSDGTLEGSMLRQHLHDIGVTMHAGVTVTERHPGRLAGRTQFADAFDLDVDDLVLVTHQVPRDGLYRQLTADPAGLVAAGIDAVHLDRRRHGTTLDLGVRLRRAPTRARDRRPGSGVPPAAPA